MTSDSVRWALLGAGWIAQTALGTAFRSADGVSLDVVAARSLDRANKLQPSRYATTDYQRAVEDPEIDAVYIALDNGGHERWIEASIACGKSVICEKPLTPSARSTAHMFACADQAGTTLIEAAWNLWHPRTQRAMELVRNGAIGNVNQISGTFTFEGVPEGNYRLDPSRGGGAMLDVGCYPLMAAAWATQGTAMTLSSVSVDTSQEAVDMTCTASFTSKTSETGDNCNIRVRASFMEPAKQSLVIDGSEGSLEWIGDDAFTSFMQPSSLRILGSRGTHEETFTPVDSYRLMIEQVSIALRGGQSWVPPNLWSLRVSEAIDQVLGSMHEHA
jgi:predicted dehydrogenase